jgi:hypothetical protein
MPLGTAKGVNYGAVQQLVDGVSFTPVVTATVVVTANTAVYSVTSNYVTQPTLNFDFSGLVTNPFVEAETGSITLATDGTASITRTLDQTTTYANADFAVNLKGYDNSILFTGANVNLLGSVQDSSINTAPWSLTEYLVADDYVVYKSATPANAGIQSSFKRVLGTDPYAGAKDALKTFQWEIVGGGGGAYVAGDTTGANGGQVLSGNFNFDLISTTRLQAFTVGLGGDEYAGIDAGDTSITWHSSVGIPDVLATGGDHDNPDGNYILQSSIVGGVNTMLQATAGGKGYNGLFDQPSLILENNPIQAGDTVTLSGGNGGQGTPSTVLSGNYIGGGGGGYARQSSTGGATPGFTIILNQGTAGAGEFGQGASAVFPSVNTIGQPGALLIRIPRIKGFYPVLSEIV